MLPSVRKVPLKPNWWTITPVLASLALWGGILYAGAGSDRDDQSERFADISQSEELAMAGH